jgi:hypothetical protein
MQQFCGGGTQPIPHIFLVTGKLTGQIFASAEREAYPTRRVFVRKRDFFATAIL